MRYSDSMTEELKLGARLRRVAKGIAQKSASLARCSAAPVWYTSEEMRHYLRCKRYSDEVANELSVDYASNLQKAFNKGFELGKRAARQQD